ncbi:MAG: hypothetical protein RR448_01705 [Niameybacter sp.]|uniref:hypothetical protein n=1 Tax=Niameybacter sp. TaxID=2033640 RepID=UPI002FC779E6
MNEQLGLIAVLGISYLLLNQGNGCGCRGEKEQGYKQFKSELYNITFKYPAAWTKNPNYEERYDGSEGFVEIGEIEAFNRPIDTVAKQEISIPIKPYGTKPKIMELELDGEPARVIVPSEDQNKVFDRELAIIVKNKKPVKENGETYDYAIIWTDKANLEMILNSFKFL